MNIATLISCLKFTPARREIKEGKSNRFISDDEYLRSIDGIVQSIREAREELEHNGVTLDKLDW